MNNWPTFDLHRGDMRAVLATFPENHFSAGVCDPPYGLGFMGKGWDHGVPGVDFWQAYYRVLRPGAHLVAFSSPRTFHRLTVAIEDAGFEIRDCLLWLYGTGFPKGLDVAKAIDKQRHDRDEVLEVCAWIRERRDAVGLTNGDIDRQFGFNGMAGHWTSVGTQPAIPTLEQVPTLFALLQLDPLSGVPGRIRDLLIELNGKKGEFGAAWHAREVTGTVDEWADRQNYALTSRDGLRRDRAHSDDARTWEGWNTALKPAWEPIVLARKPLPNGWTITDTVLEYGTGAINIGACRIDGERWPANLILDPIAAAMIDAAAPDAGGNSSVPSTAPSALSRTAYNDRDRVGFEAYGDEGGASRFFYCAKATRDERDAGLEGWEEKPLNWSSGDANPGSFQSPGTKKSAANFHPTVKPLALMRWVCRLITPPDGIILDSFVGSGSTICAAMLDGFGAVGVDLDTNDATGEPIGYLDISRARATYWRGEAIRLAEGGARPPAEVAPDQLDIF